MKRSNLKNKFWLGVDGCRGGWLVCRVDSQIQIDFQICETISQIWEDFRHASLIFIDIPIGLPGKDIKSRSCDFEARRKIGQRRSSVFPVPCRKAVYADSYKQACQINLEVTGKKISKQCWNICDKIKEVDQHLLNHQAAQKIVHECHPELSFWGLKGGIELKFNKYKEDGFNERVKIIKKYIPGITNLIDIVSANLPAKQYDRTDLMDSIANALVAKNGFENQSLASVGNQIDEKGLRMEIVFSEESLTLRK